MYAAFRKPRPKKCPLGKVCPLPGSQLPTSCPGTRGPLCLFKAKPASIGAGWVLNKALGWSRAGNGRTLG